MRLWIGLGLVILPRLAWASVGADPTGLTQAMSPVVFGLTAFFYIVGGLAIVWLGIDAVISVCGDREHLPRGLMKIAGCLLVGVFMWQVIPGVSRGISSAAAATPEPLNPPAILMELDE